jgi:hypothetical protein
LEIEGEKLILLTIRTGLSFLIGIFLAMPLEAQEQFTKYPNHSKLQKPSNYPKISNLPNLSIEVDSPTSELDPGVSTTHNRAKTIRELELNVNRSKWLTLDPLGQELLLLRESRRPNYRGETSIGKKEISDFKATTRSGRSLIFLDFNFAPAEIEAARASANVRGDDFILIPERTDAQQLKIERLYRKVNSLFEQWQRCKKEGVNDCDAIWNDLKVAREAFDNEIRAIKPLTELSVLFSELQAQGVKPSIIVFSGHSSGAGDFTGFFGHIIPEQIAEAFKFNSGWLEEVSSVLLWGCYTGTLGNMANFWQKQLSPSVAFIGYRNQAPLGIRPASGKLLKSYLINEVSFRSAPTPKEAHVIFRQLDLLADLDATAVFGDEYFAYERYGNIQEMLKLCDEFDVPLLEKYACYNQGKPGCENPPDDHRGPLRELYTFLQVNRHCRDILMQKHGMLPTPESLIRLIYIDNIKANFIKHHKFEFPHFNDLISQWNLPENLKIENFFNDRRSKDLQQFELMRKALQSTGLRDGRYLQEAGGKDLLRIKWAHYSIKLVFQTIDPISAIYTCTPFSWVEPDSKEQDTCLFSGYLGLSPSVLGEELINNYLFDDQFFFWSKESIPEVLGLLFRRSLTLIDLKPLLLQSLDSEILRLEGLSERSETEQRWLLTYRNQREEVLRFDDREAGERIIRDLQTVLSKLETLIVAARNTPEGNMAAEDLNFKRVYASQQVDAITALLH